MRTAVQLVAESGRLIVFPKRMAAQAPIPPQLDPQAQTGYIPQKHGNWAQWIAPAVTLAIGIVTISAMVHYRNADAAKANSDEHINTLIHGQLDPATKSINEHIDKLSEKTERLTERVARLEGPLTNRVSTLEHRVEQQTSLAKLIDPNRILAVIRVELQMAQASTKLLPVSEIDDYKNAVQALPSSARDYWKTVAAIINYQSLINQMSGEAPDPLKVSRPCVGVTEGTGGYNYMTGVVFERCVIDLDTTDNTLLNVVFKDSVIRYHGGSVHIRALFFNCAFILDLPPNKSPAQPAILYALLNSPDLRKVRVSTAR